MWYCHNHNDPKNKCIRYCMVNAIETEPSKIEFCDLCSLKLFDSKIWLCQQKK